MEQTVDAGDALLQLVRTSSEVAIAPSLRRSWRSGSGPSEGGDQLGLCDRHKPGYDLERDATELRAAAREPSCGP